MGEFPQPEKTKRITLKELSVIASRDIRGFDNAFDWVIDDIVNSYLARHPDAREKDELLSIYSSPHPVTEEQFRFVMDFIQHQVGISLEELKYQVLQCYATQNDYEILTQ